MTRFKSPSPAPEKNFSSVVCLRPSGEDNCHSRRELNKDNHWIGESELVSGLVLNTSPRGFEKLGMVGNIVSRHEKDRSISSLAIGEIFLFLPNILRGQFIPKVRGLLREICPLYGISLNIWCLRGMRKVINIQEPREEWLTPGKKRRLRTFRLQRRTAAELRDLSLGIKAQL